jgi:hypothetical protein
VTASAATTPSATDIANAATILAQYEKNIKAEVDAKGAPATFTTVYTPDSATAIQFTYAATTTGYVKVDPSSTSNLLTKTSGKEYDSIAVNASTSTIRIIAAGDTTNKSLEAKDIVNGSVVKVSGVSSGYAYVTLTNVSANAAAITKAASEGVYLIAVGNASANYDRAGSPIVTTDKNTKTSVGDLIENGTARHYDVTSVKAVKLTFFTPADTGKKVAGTTAVVDSYGVDKDGYIALTAGTATKYLSLASGYYATVGAASTDTLTSVASALADGTITKDAAAVDLTFYELVAANPYAEGSETGFYTLQKVNAKLTDTTVSFATDWLSRTSAKNANAVFIVDKNVTSVIPYVSAINATYKVSDYADGKFTTNYLASGTYVFDTVADASNNDGAAAENTTTTAAASTSSSPKTGDVAPIAALAVVMMGAFGALVVASKKRA